MQSIGSLIELCSVQQPATLLELMQLDVPKHEPGNPTAQRKAMAVRLGSIDGGYITASATLSVYLPSVNTTSSAQVNDMHVLSLSLTLATPGIYH